MSFFGWRSIDSLLLSGLVICVSGAVFAGPWETFEQTCLGPMEAQGDPNLEHLSAQGTTSTSPSQFYRDSEDRTVSVMRAQGVVFCSVRTLGPEDSQVALDLTRWLEGAFRSDRYRTIGPFKVQSTGWRDPPLIFEFRTWGDGTSSLSVGEWPDNG